MNQAENLVSVPFRQAEAAALVVENVEGGATAQRFLGTVVEVVDNGFDLGAQVWANGGVRVQALVELAFEIADAFFDGPVAERVARRAVKRQNAVAPQDLVHGFMVERAAVVPYQKQRRALGEEDGFESGGDLVSVFSERSQEQSDSGNRRPAWG